MDPRLDVESLAKEHDHSEHGLVEESAGGVAAPGPGAELVVLDDEEADVGDDPERPTGEVRSRLERGRLFVPEEGQDQGLFLPRQGLDRPVISRGHFDPEHVLFIGADGKPVTEQMMFDRFSCDVVITNPETPDPAEPDVTFAREFFQARLLTAPDGRKIRMFGLKERDGEPQFPAPTMRMVEGQLVHSAIHAKKNSHTIHHHGIEPTNFNDGVGHTSFEVTGSYVYQWRPTFSGTYFYHCHKNTTLHFEMGMYGFLIVDPPMPPGVSGPEPPFADGGPGFVRENDSIVAYEREALWAVDEIDSLWHEIINHKAGLSCPFFNVDEEGEPTGADSPGLHSFHPDVFVISGVVVPEPDPALSRREPITDPRVAVYSNLGETVLVRLLNAGNTVQRYTFSTDVEVISVDGRPLGAFPRARFSRAFVIPAGTPFELTSARRFGLLLRPPHRGTFPVRVDYLDWITRRPWAVAETFIQVS